MSWFYNWLETNVELWRASLLKSLMTETSSYYRVCRCRPHLDGKGEDFCPPAAAAPSTPTAQPCCHLFSSFRPSYEVLFEQRAAWGKCLAHWSRGKESEWKKVGSVVANTGHAVAIISLVTGAAQWTSPGLSDFICRITQCSVPSTL